MLHARVILGAGSEESQSCIICIIWGTNLKSVLLKIVFTLPLGVTIYHITAFQ